MLAALGVGLTVSLTLYVEARVAEAHAKRENYVATFRAAESSLRAGELEEAKKRLGLAAAELRGWEWWHLASRLDSASRVLQVGLPVHHVRVTDSGAIEAIGQSREFSESWRSISWLPDSTKATDVGPTLPARTKSIVIATSADGKLLLANDRVEFSEGGITTSADSKRRIYDRRTGQMLRELVGSDPAWLSAVGAFSPDSQRIATLIRGRLRIYDLMSPASYSETTLPLPRNRSDMGCLTFSGGGRQIACGVAASLYLFDHFLNRRSLIQLDDLAGPCILLPALMVRTSSPA